METQGTPGAGPAELTVAAYDARCAELDDERAVLAREIADATDGLQKFAATIRPERKAPAPGQRRDVEEEYRWREEMRTQAAALASEEETCRVRVGALREQMDAIGDLRAKLLRERHALYRLDVLDDMAACTRAANAALAALAGAVDMSSRAALRQRADTAIRRRRALWLIWKLQLGGGDVVPELLTNIELEESVDATE